jgi:hypothetical protein
MNADGEVLTAVGVKSSVFWDIMPCSLLEINRLCEGACRHRLQGRPKRRLIFNRIDCIISQKMKIFLGTECSYIIRCCLKRFFRLHHALSRQHYERKVPVCSARSHIWRCCYLSYFVNTRNSAVSIATGYGLDGRGFGVRVQT